MSSISLPAIGAFLSTYGGAVAAGTAALSAGLTAYESSVQGTAQANQAKQKARVEADQATQQQISMRQNMLRGLATQNASSLGAVGTGTGSGFGANVNRQLTQGQNDLLVSQANSSAQVSLLDQQASNAEQAGTIGAIGGGINALGLGVKALGSIPSNPGYNPAFGEPT